MFLMHIFLAITFSNDCVSLPHYWLFFFIYLRPLISCKDAIKHKWKDYTNKQDNVQQVSMQNKQLQGDKKKLHFLAKFIFVIMTVHYPLKHLSVTLLLSSTAALLAASVFVL